MVVRKIHGSWWVDFRFKRIRYRKRSPLNTKTGAKEYELLLRQKLSSGGSIEEERVRKKELIFQDFCQEWFLNYVKVNNKPSVIQTKEHILRFHLIPFFGRKELSRFNVLDIEKYKLKKLEAGLSKKTVNNHLSVIGTCLKMAKEWYGIDCLPKIKFLKIQPKRMDFLTEAELQILLNNAHGMFRNMILLAAKTGLRLGELIGLKWSDIDFYNGTLTVRRAIVRNIEGSPKSNKHRTIPLTQELKAMLAKNKQKGGYVFQTRPGHPLSTNNCYLNIQKIRKKADLRNIGWHTLRHTFASHLAMKGAPTFAIKELMGHADIQTTMRYTHLAPSTLVTAISFLEPNSKNFGQQAVNTPKTIKFPEKNICLILPNNKEKQGINPVNLL